MVKENKKNDTNDRTKPIFYCREANFSQGSNKEGIDSDTHKYTVCVSSKHNVITFDMRTTIILVLYEIIIYHSYT